MAAIAEPQLMTIYVKLLSGEVLTVECPADTLPEEFPTYVHPHLEEPRPPMAYLRFLGSGGEEEEKNEEKRPVRANYSLEDGCMLYLFVDDPQLDISFLWQDDALLSSGDRMKLFRMEARDQNNVVVFVTSFYTPVLQTYEYVDGEDIYVYYFTNVYYHEDDIEVVFNQHERVRELTGVEWRDVVLRTEPGATAHTNPRALAYLCPEYESYLSDAIWKAWREYIKETTGQDALYAMRIPVNNQMQEWMNWLEEVEYMEPVEAVAQEAVEDQEAPEAGPEEEDYDY